jgi:hypothetical protein
MCGRATAAAVALLTALVLRPASAGASENATATGTTAVTSATWAATTTTVGGTPTSGTFTTLTFTVVLLPAPPQYFDVVNNGTATLVATTYQVGLSASGLSLGGVSLTLKSCSLSAGWNQGAGTCTGGTITTITGGFSGASSSVDSTVAPLAASSRIHLQASVGGLNVAGSVTATIQTLVSSKTPRDIAAAATSNR